MDKGWIRLCALGLGAGLLLSCATVTTRPQGGAEGQAEGRALVLVPEGEDAGPLAAVQPLLSHPVLGLAFRPDGRQLLVVSFGNPPRVYDVPAGREVRRLPQGQYTFAAFSRDGRQLALGAEHYELALYDWARGARVPLPPETRAGSYLDHAALAASFDERGRLRVATRSQLQIYAEDGKADVQERYGSAAAFSADGRRAAIGQQEEITVVDAGSWARIVSFSAGREPDEISFSADGALLATVHREGPAKVWDAATGKLRYQLKGDAGSIDQVTFSPRGDLVAAAGDDAVLLFDAATGALLRSLPFTGPRSLAFSPDGRALAVGDRGVALFDVASGHRLARMASPPDESGAAVFGADGRSLLLASGDGSAALLSTETGLLLRDLSEGGPAITAAAVSPGGRTFALGTRQGAVLLFDARGGAPRRVVVRDAAGPEGDGDSHQAGHIIAVAVSPDERLLVTADNEHILRVQEIGSGRTLHRLDLGAEESGPPVFSPDGRYLGLRIHDGRVFKVPYAVVLDLATGRPAFGFLSRFPLTLAFTFTGDGKHAVLLAPDLGEEAGADKDAHLVLHKFALGSGEHVARHVLPQDAAPLPRLSSPDGRYLALRKGDEPSVTIMDLWGPIEHGRLPVRDSKGPQDERRPAALSRDGAQAVVPGTHGESLLLRGGGEHARLCVTADGWYAVRGGTLYRHDDGGLVMRGGPDGPVAPLPPPAGMPPRLRAEVVPGPAGSGRLVVRVSNEAGGGRAYWVALRPGEADAGPALVLPPVRLRLEPGQRADLPVSLAAAPDAGPARARPLQVTHAHGAGPALSVRFP